MLSSLLFKDYKSSVVFLCILYDLSENWEGNVQIEISHSHSCAQEANSQQNSRRLCSLLIGV